MDYKLDSISSLFEECIPEEDIFDKTYFPYYAFMIRVSDNGECKVLRKHIDGHVSGVISHLSPCGKDFTRLGRNEVRKNGDCIEILTESLYTFHFSPVVREEVAT